MEEFKDTNSDEKGVKILMFLFEELNLSLQFSNLEECF
jgi:hypothetical protein